MEVFEIKKESINIYDNIKGTFEVEKKKKKKSMGLTAFLSLATIIVLKEILNGSF